MLREKGKNFEESFFLPYSLVVALPQYFMKLFRL
jgi:hypothetical protein